MARMVVLLTHGYNETQVNYAYYRAQEDALQVEFASVDGDEIEGSYGSTTETSSISDISPGTIDILIIPGGDGINKIVNDAEFVNLVQTVNDYDSIIGAIGNGVMSLSKSNVLEGRLVTTTPAGRSAVQEAGGNYVEDRVSVDENIITAPSNTELPFFISAVLHAHAIPQRRAEEALERSHWA